MCACRAKLAARATASTRHPVKSNSITGTVNFTVSRTASPLVTSPFIHSYRVIVLTIQLLCIFTCSIFGLLVFKLRYKKVIVCYDHCG